ncbi:hypothetical protein BGW80DRAFT_1459107 [Lactifluus volemus]|nr:hypothetical protein BGW80DRAFT_1459107 [Lactifluus volemus]
MSHTLQVILAYRSFVVTVHSLFVVALALFTISVAYVLYIVMRHCIHVYRPLCGAGEFDTLAEEWVKTYGHVLKYHSFFGDQKLLALDPVAISYILQNDDTFQKSDMQKYIIGTLTGNGLIVVAGSEHRKQRKVLNPAFGPTQVRNFTSLFLDKSLELREIWADLVPSHQKGWKAEARRM